MNWANSFWGYFPSQTVWSEWMFDLDNTIRKTSAVSSQQWRTAMNEQTHSLHHIKTIQPFFNVTSEMPMSNGECFIGYYHSPDPLVSKRDSSSLLYLCHLIWGSRDLLFSHAEVELDHGDMRAKHGRMEKYWVTKNLHNFPRTFNTHWTCTTLLSFSDWANFLTARCTHGAHININHVRYALCIYSIRSCTPIIIS